MVSKVERFVRSVLNWFLARQYPGQRRLFGKLCFQKCHPKCKPLPKGARKRKVHTEDVPLSRGQNRIYSIIARGILPAIKFPL